MNTHKFVSAIIRDDIRILASTCSQGQYKGLWEFPWTELKAGDDPREALKQAILEQLHIEISVEKRLPELLDTDPDSPRVMEYYWCRLAAAEPQSVVLPGTMWMDRVDLRRERSRWVPEVWLLVDSLPKTQWDKAAVDLAEKTAKTETDILMQQLYNEEEASRYDIDLKAAGALAAHGVYEDIALRLIQRLYPQADETCFSGRYAVMEEGNKVIFIDRASSWEYPGAWYPNGNARTTGEERIESLVKEGIFRFLLGRRGAFRDRLYEF